MTPLIDPIGAVPTGIHHHAARKWIEFLSKTHHILGPASTSAPIQKLFFRISKSRHLKLMTAFFYLKASFFLIPWQHDISHTLNIALTNCVPEYKNIFSTQDWPPLSFELRFESSKPPKDQILTNRRPTCFISSDWSHRVGPIRSRTILICSQVVSLRLARDKIIGQRTPRIYANGAILFTRVPWCNFNFPGHQYLEHHRLLDMIQFPWRSPW